MWKKPYQVVATSAFKAFVTAINPCSPEHAEFPVEFPETDIMNFDIELCGEIKDLSDLKKEWSKLTCAKIRKNPEGTGFLIDYQTDNKKSFQTAGLNGILEGQNELLEGINRLERTEEKSIDDIIERGQLDVVILKKEPENLKMDYDECLLTNVGHTELRRCFEFEEEIPGKLNDRFATQIPDTRIILEAGCMDLPQPYCCTLVDKGLFDLQPSERYMVRKDVDEQISRMEAFYKPLPSGSKDKYVKCYLLPDTEKLRHMQVQNYWLQAGHLGLDWTKYGNEGSGFIEGSLLYFFSGHKSIFYGGETVLDPDSQVLYRKILAKFDEGTRLRMTGTGEQTIQLEELGAVVKTTRTDDNSCTVEYDNGQIFVEKGVSFAKLTSERDIYIFPQSKREDGRTKSTADDGDPTQQTMIENNRRSLDETKPPKNFQPSPKKNVISSGVPTSTKIIKPITKSRKHIDPIPASTNSFSTKSTRSSPPAKSAKNIQPIKSQIQEHEVKTSELRKPLETKKNAKNYQMKTKSSASQSTGPGLKVAGVAVVSSLCFLAYFLHGKTKNKKKESYRKSTGKNV